MKKRRNPVWRKNRIVSFLQDITIAAFFIGYMVWFFIAPLGA